MVGDLTNEGINLKYSHQGSNIKYKILSLFNNVDYDYTLMEMYPQADFKIYARVTCVYALPR